jgi:cold shock protein
MSQLEKGASEKGVVKWFNDAKGFGFIEHSSGKDVFVHYSVIISDGFKTLKDGEGVEYEMTEGEKGLHAVRVRRVDAPLSDEANVDLESEAEQSQNSLGNTLENGLEIERSVAQKSVADESLAATLEGIESETALQNSYQSAE